MSAPTLDGVRCAPACLHEPPGRAGSYGDDVAEIAERIGRPMVPEQLAAVDVLMAHDRRGRFLSIEAGIEGPRQTVGKSGGIMLPIALWTALTDPDDITWTAHLAETSLKQFADLCGEDPDDEAGLINSCDWLRRRVRKISYENGSEGVSFVNHAHIGFKVRSPGRGRGMSGNTIIDDEFLFMTAAQVGAQAPVLATRSLHGNARAYRASSAAGKKSDVLRALRRRAVTGDPTLTYVGWWAAGGWEHPGCASPLCSHELGSVGCALDDEDLLRTCNPLIDRLVSMDFLRSMRAGMTPLEYGREFLGWQEEPDGAGNPPITVADWRNQIDPNSAIVAEAPIVISVEIPLSRKSTAIGVAGWREDGGAHVGLIEYLPGVDGALARILELAGSHTLHKVKRGKSLHPAIIIDPTSPAGMLVDPLRKAGFDPVLMTAGEVGASCAGLQDALTEHTVWHRGSALVDVAIEGAVRRDLGDGNWAFGRRKSAGAGVDVAPVVALVQARWGLTVAKKSYNLLDSFH